MLIETIEKNTFLKNNLESLEKLCINFNELKIELKGPKINAYKDFIQLQHLVK